jgi:hypothetical protein
VSVIFILTNRAFINHLTINIYKKKTNNNNNTTFIMAGMEKKLAKKKKNSKLVFTLLYT